MKSFDDAFSFVVGAEGGFGDDPKDRGNWDTGIIGEGNLNGTKFGISAMSYPHIDIKHMTMETAESIYLRDYWKPMYCDLLLYPQALMLFDSAVNQGKRRATKFAQRASLATLDGIMGMQTIGAIERMPATLFVKLFTEEREKHYRSLKTFERYGKGWLNRLEHVRKEAFINA